MNMDDKRKVVVEDPPVIDPLANRLPLHVYALSGGLARQLSMSFLGKAIEGIWHTSVVVYGAEYFFGAGIQQIPAAKSVEPDEDNYKEAIEASFKVFAPQGISRQAYKFSGQHKIINAKANNQEYLSLMLIPQRAIIHDIYDAHYILFVIVAMDYHRRIAIKVYSVLGSQKRLDNKYKAAEEASEDCTKENNLRLV
ncbi:hypothetical protein L2E82_47616 [Cichorium intybus]|uniref:Uncharacterized protein n=1 Tax=Cichorium intybus TaxID=13427 RepID=A0ACB8YWI7_CICIN|nr:hypothetical protein L2E82_47616 [Cichorium intybus]